MLHRLFHPTVSLYISGGLFLLGIFLSTGRILGIFGTDEPALVFHMSALAITATGYDAIETVMSRKEKT